MSSRFSSYLVKYDTVIRPLGSRGGRGEPIGVLEDITPQVFPGSNFLLRQNSRGFEPIWKLSKMRTEASS